MLSPKERREKGKKYHPVYHHPDEEKEEDNHQHPVEKKDTAGKGRE